jgi:hypothetical protein
MANQHVERGFEPSGASGVPAVSVAAYLRAYPPPLTSLNHRPIPEASDA